MAILTERNIVLVSKDSNGNTCLDYPLTKAEQVEDLEKYVKEHGSNLDVMTGATSSAAGKAGLAPAPAAGKQNMPLCGDATYKVLPIAGGGTGAPDAATARKNLGLTGTGVDAKAYITETYKNGTEWYRKWSDGWIEQGGKNYCNSSLRTITFLKPFKNTDYKVLTNTRDHHNSGYQICVYSRTTSDFQAYYAEASGNINIDWYACGQGA